MENEYYFINPKVEFICSCGQEGAQEIHQTDDTKVINIECVRCDANHSFEITWSIKEYIND